VNVLINLSFLSLLVCKPLQINGNGMEIVQVTPLRRTLASSP